MAKQRCIAIVLARGGSKRIPNKNLKMFFDKPLVTHAIDALLSSNIFDQVIVSTDSKRIKSVAEKSGALVPFLRPEYLSDDLASTDDALLHSIKEIERLYGTFELSCCAYPNPFIEDEKLREALEKVSSGQAKTCFPAIKFSTPIQQAFEIVNGQLNAVNPSALKERSQDLPIHFHDAGMFYFFDVEHFKANKTLIEPTSSVFEVDPMECHDINTIEDWALAEQKYTWRKKS